MSSLFGHAKDPNHLLKQATVKKQAGDIDAAIELLRKAYARMAKVNAGATVATYLRLPLYLQAANRPEEAWREFQKLLTNGYPNQIEETKSIDTWQIYDKMRLFLQRERNHREAAKHAVFSHFYQCLSMHEQKRRINLKTLMSKAAVRELVEEFFELDRNREDELASLLLAHLSCLPKIDIVSLGSQIDAVVDGRGNPERQGKTIRSGPSGSKTMRFRNPSNGYTEKVSMFVWLWVLLFGGFYFIVKGVWTHAIAGFL